tara:strand:+ start:4822 stop:5886 length:1065 start_codon:yes stop_codon:yes gene_type:complete
MLLRKILFPIAALNYLLQSSKSFFYSKKILKAHKTKVNTICVGNLSLGGTGKTPLVKFLIERLSEKINISVLSRGYKRKTKGFIEVSDESDVNDVGDENFMIKKSFKKINVFACENRLNAINKILKKFSDVDLIILDDAMQHRKIKCDLNILLTKFEQPFYNDLIFPVGDLREPRIGYKRANIIIVTKCPDNLTNSEKENIINKIKPLNHQRIFFSKVDYEDILKGKRDIHISALKTDFLLVTGIADSLPLTRYLKSKKYKFNHLIFNDHHSYNQNDIRKILKLSQDKIILTTKKDYFKILSIHEIKNLYYIDITIDFFGKSNDLIGLIAEKFRIEKEKRDKELKEVARMRNKD